MRAQGKPAFVPTILGGRVKKAIYHGFPVSNGAQNRVKGPEKGIFLPTPRSFVSDVPGEE
jgi:hypothetical protein